MFEWAPNAPDDLPVESISESSEIEGPQFVRYFGPLLKAIRELGGSAKPRAAIKKVAESVDVTERELAEKTKGGQSKFENQVGWARFYLCRAGLIDGKVRGLWTLSESGSETNLDHKSALELFREIHSRYQDSSEDEDAPAPDPVNEISSEL